MLEGLGFAGQLDLGDDESRVDAEKLVHLPSVSTMRHHEAGFFDEWFFAEIVEHGVGVSNGYVVFVLGAAGAPSQPLDGKDTPVTDDPHNPFDIDLIVFGNTGFLDSSFPGAVVGGLFGADGGVIEVSADGRAWHRIEGIVADGMFPTCGYLDGGAYDTVRGGAGNAGGWWSETVALAELYARAWPGDDRRRVRVMFIGIAAAASRPAATAHLSRIVLSR